MKIKKNFIKVKKIKGIWWFIDPDGRKFISLGVNHIEPHLWLILILSENTLMKL